MASYILRGIDPELWQRVKLKALAQKLTIRLLVEKLLNDWLKSDV